jgi:hypothetical protein
MTTEFSEDEKERISIMIRREISETENMRYQHQKIVVINKQKPSLEDENKEAKRQELIQQREKIIEFFTKDIELLEKIQNKLTIE